MIFRRFRLLVSSALAAGLVGGLGACSHNDKIAKANDALREKNMDLEKQVDGLGRRVRELEAQVRADAMAASATGGGIPAEILENTPRPASLSIDRLSFARDKDRDGRIDSLYVIVEPEDGMARFVPLVGRMTATVTITGADADGSPRVIARLALAPRELRDAYRATMTSIHYALEMPIEGVAPDVGACDVEVSYVDGYTGQTLKARREIPLRAD